MSKTKIHTMLNNWAYDLGLEIEERNASKLSRHLMEDFGPAAAIVLVDELIDIIKNKQVEEVA
jgi:hypothetical protein